MAIALRILAVFALLLVAGASAQAQTAQKAGVVLRIAGFSKVSVRTGAATRQVEGGAELFVGDRISTSIDQSVAIRFADGSEIVVGPASDLMIDDVRIDKPRKTLLSLAYGALFSAVRKIYGPHETFVVRTPAGSMGVRGTRFVVEGTRGGEEATLHTLEGSVAIGRGVAEVSDSAGGVAVGAGQLSAARAGSAPSDPKSFDIGQYRAELAQRYPTLAQLMKEIEARHAAASGAGDATGSDDGVSFPNGLKKSK